MLDTHVLIWWLDDDPRLSAGARAALADPRHNLVMSIASFWEMAIKFRQGKLQIAGSVAHRTALRQQISVIGINHSHLVALEALPERANHKDPFDRLILAQALSEDMALMTGDRQMLGYGVSCVGIG